MSSKDTNDIGLSKADYVGAKSTLCVGCGHDSVTNHIVQACYQANVKPSQLVKISGIGCSSKTTNYFMNQSHGINSIHGRMAAVATGAKVANHKLKVIGVSGDGDSASIGLGGLLHLFRRNLPMVYILENNGVYGLTKGQFSATAPESMQLKTGDANPFTGLDLCALAIQSGCSFVARSFSGDAKQLVPLIKAAMTHPGTAFIDIISPCITYANHATSTMSYDYVREHKVSLQDIGIIEDFEAHKADYEPGTHTTIQLADGSTLVLKKLQEDYDVSSYNKSLAQLHEAMLHNQVLTGLIYYQNNRPSALDSLKLGEQSLSEISNIDLLLGQDNLDQALKEFT